MRHFKGLRGERISTAVGQTPIVQVVKGQKGCGLFPLLGRHLVGLWVREAPDVVFLLRRWTMANYRDRGMRPADLMVGEVYVRVMRLWDFGQRVEVIARIFGWPEEAVEEVVAVGLWVREVLR